LKDEFSNDELGSKLKTPYLVFVFKVTFRKIYDFKLTILDIRCWWYSTQSKISSIGVLRM